ncbi:hypothetical protein [Burkholderia sp. Ac-20344]|uniref:hypothetical protein n=1 Tax=Burkholderia sp. Ac-20344 TaxID=2703890 RepID=UPI00197C84BD|nr:hypothetical protein [Burkholderia sp. Ac-20344]MBN3834116.1 hypothetical protein [Burkholderia sp. Ac-20344]
MRDWLRIVDERDDTRKMLGDAVQRTTARDRLGFVFRDARQGFVDRLDASCAALAEVIAEIDAWTREVRIRHDQVTIPGI